MAAAWLTAGLAAVLLSTGCSRELPVVDHTVSAAEPALTISGTVHGPERAAAGEGRVVEAINVETLERHRAETNRSGAFTLKVRPGKYRVQLSLRNGESLVQQPEVLNVNGTSAGAHADFVIRSIRVSRPRGPAYRTDNGLGSPIADARRPQLSDASAIS